MQSCFVRFVTGRGPPHDWTAEVLLVGTPFADTVCQRRNTMANLTVNKTAAAPAPTMTRWDPFSSFREFMRWDPFREIAPLSSMDRLNEIVAPFEVKETKESYVFKADVPGIKESDLTINLSGNRLSVSGKREEEKKQESETYFSYERSY